jgi:hypothetical protein
MSRRTVTGEMPPRYWQACFNLNAAGMIGWGDPPNVSCNFTKLYNVNEIFYVYDKFLAENCICKFRIIQA